MEHPDSNHAHENTLSEHEGLQLFAQHLAIPLEQLPNPPLLRTIIQLLGGLRLAVNLIAAWLADQPDRLSFELLDWLRQNPHRFVHLALRDEQQRQPGLEYALYLVYTDLGDDLRGRFRTLGIFAPRAPLTSEAAAAVWGDADAATAEAQLQQLARAGLLDVVAPGHFRQSDALASYAYGLLRCRDEWHAPDEWQTACQRHMVYFAGFARQHGSPESMQRLAAQLPNLEVAFETAVAQSDSGCAYEIVWFSESVLELLGFWEQRQAWLTAALAMLQGTDRETNRRTAQLRGALADTFVRCEAIAEAEALLHEARAGFELAGDMHSVAITTGKLAELAVKRGATTEARNLLHETLAAFEQVGDTDGMRFVRDSLAQLPGCEPSVAPVTARPDTSDGDFDALDDGAITQLMAGMETALERYAEGATDDVLGADMLALLEEAGDAEHGGVPGEFIELRLPPIIAAYREGGEPAVREHVRSLGMAEEVVQQVIMDLPMLLEQADDL